MACDRGDRWLPWAPMLLIPRCKSLLKPSILVAALSSACSGGGGGDEPGRAKLASDLVQCQNDKSGLKDQIAELKAELTKLKSGTDPTRHLEGIELKGSIGAAPTERTREGNV